jgi:hypothetical protein
MQDKAKSFEKNILKIVKTITKILKIHKINNITQHIKFQN